MTLTVEWRRGRDLLLVAASGEVDASASTRLQEGIAAAHAVDEPASPTLVLDLTHVDFLDSAGLAVLVETASDCHKAGQELRLVATTRAVLNPLKLTGLDQIFTIVDTVPAGT